MKHRMNEPVKVSVTKSRPGQLVGLSLEQQGNKIVVTDVFGLLKSNNLPVHIGDELLEVNGTRVTNKEEFPRGLKDIQMFLRREWHICVKVRMGAGNVNRLQIEEKESVEMYGIVAKETKKWNDFVSEGSESEDDSINLSEIENDDEKTTNNNTRMSRSTKPRRKRGPRARSQSPFSVFSRAEKRKGKKKTPAQQKAFHESYSDSLSNTTGTTHTILTDDDTPPRGEERTCQTGTLLDIDENDTVLVSPISPEHEPKPSSETGIKSIHGTDDGITLELDDGKTVSIPAETLLAAVTEHQGLDDSVSSLLKNSSATSLGAPMVWDPNVKPKSKLEEMMEEEPKQEKSKSKKDLKSPKRDRPKGKAPRRSSMPSMLPSVSHQPFGGDPSQRTTDASSLRNLMNDGSVRVCLSTLLAEHTDKMSSDKPSSLSSRMSTFSRTCPATKQFINDLRSSPKPTRRSSMPMVESQSSHNRTLALASITENKQEKQEKQKKRDKPQALKTKKKRSKSPDSLPDETSHHSTHSCFTNLIDPGDLMKIHGFRSKPKFNGATVEVVRKSKGHKGKRWDVRIVSKRHIKNTSFNAKRLISVSKDNLKHFM